MVTSNEIEKQLDGFRSEIYLDEICDLDVCSKSVLQRYINGSVSLNSSSIIKIQAIIDYMYEQINIGNWREVKLYIRKTVTIASYLRVLAHFKCCDNLTEDAIKEAFKIIDFGILFGCPLDKQPKLLQNCATCLSSLNLQAFPRSIIGASNSKCEEVHNDSNKYYVVSIEVVDCPSMESFFKNYILAEKPVVLNNCINHWPAFSKWNDQNYFIKLAGMRTVSVELGSKYTDSEWTQKLMMLEEFIREHIYQRPNGPTGYLAQYQLFDQIPELRNDISEPEYCCFSDNNNPVDIMAWYGPKGTISPLHHDPKRNLLAQVVGEKHLFLFSPKDSEYLYPHEHELLNNTARVDPRQPDFQNYPKYKEAKAFYCKLSPGQMLYIPPKWWHFVESLSISFSVSFWWT